MLEKNKNLSPREVKRKLMDSCVNLNDNRESQGAGLIDLEKLFYVENREKNENIIGKPIEKDNEMFEMILVLLLVMMLLDR